MTEYIRKNGRKVTVDGNKYISEDGLLRTKVIGANYLNGMIYGGYLSSFNGTFNDELIGIESGMDDIVNTRIGDINDAYKLLREKLKDIREGDVISLAKAVLDTVDEYFNGFANASERMNYYYSIDFKESKDNKISNLKGKGAAMCVERAALAQNLLRLLGINSYFKTSGILKDNNKEAHSYNLIEFQGEYYIFDCSIPNLVNEEANPLIAKIDQETFNLLSCPLPDIGISVTVSHYNPYRNNDVTITYDSYRQRQIEVEPIGQKKKLVTIHSEIDEQSIFLHIIIHYTI